MVKRSAACSSTSMAARDISMTTCVVGPPSTVAAAMAQRAATSDNCARDGMRCASDASSN